MTSTPQIESTLSEKRRFKPARKFSEQARVNSLAQYERMYHASIKDPKAFFAKQAEELHWFRKWRKVLDWKPPFAKWFEMLQNGRVAPHIGHGPRRPNDSAGWRGFAFLGHQTEEFHMETFVRTAVLMYRIREQITS